MIAFRFVLVAGLIAFAILLLASVLTGRIDYRRWAWRVLILTAGVTALYLLLFALQRLLGL